MRFLVLFFALALVSASLGLKLSKNEHQHHDSKNSGKGLEEDVKQLIECFEEKMGEGIPELGILPMEPLLVPEATNNMSLLQLEYVSGWVTVRNLRWDGFTHWKINGLTINSTSNPEELYITYDLINPEIIVDTDYEMDYSIHDTRFFGAGHMTAKLVKVTNKGDMKITTTKPVQMNDFNIYYGLESADIKITGLFNDEEQSAQISEDISANLPSLLEEHKDKINEVSKQIIIANFNSLPPNVGELFDKVIELCQ